MNMSPLTSADGTHSHVTSSPVSVLPLNVSWLINEVHGRRPIWDKKYELHNQRDLIEASWNEIAVTVGVPVSRVRAKWKNLKDSFRREAKRAFAEMHYRPRWRLYQPLMFLCDQQPEFDLKDEDKIQSSGVLGADQTPVRLEYECDSGQASAASEARPVGPVRQFEHPGTDQYEPDGYHHVDDVDMCFFWSLVPHMKELTPQKRMQLRIKIHEMVYQEVYVDNDEHKRRIV